MRKLWMILASSSLLTLPAAAQERLLEKYLENGKLAEGRRIVEQALQAQPSNDELRFQLALAQFFGCIERFSQGMYRYGLHESIFHRTIPFLRFPVELNPNPEVASNGAIREVLQEFLRGLKETSKTLALIPDQSTVNVPLKFGRVRLDLNGDSKVTAQEELWRVMNELTNSPISEKNAARFGVHLDVADVRWLEGYCHLLSGLGEWVLAYETKELFAHCGHLFFGKTDTPYAFMQTKSGEWGEILDAVAFIHLLNFPLLDGPRLETARQHLLTVISLSRRNWDCILAESDDRFEWIPSPRQRGVVPDGRVTMEMVTSWRAFLNEAEAILEGRILLPFWREDPQRRGLNLGKVFSQPRNFDAVLWLQGSAAIPYLEEGKITSEEFWTRLNRAFRGNFLGFALWFN
jgi:hypothetical protein